MTLKLVSDEDIRYSKRRNNIKCRLCKRDYTKTTSYGEPIWIKDRNMIGNWTGQFLCYECYYKRDKICYECGTEQITRYVKMFRHYKKNIWTGNFICKDCYAKKAIDYKNKNIILTIGEGRGSLLDIVLSKVLDVPIYSIYIADKRLPFSIIHEDYGIIGIKAKKMKYNYWYFNINDYISADTYFLIGFDKKLKNISIMYAVPIKEKYDNFGRFTIYENSRKYRKLKIDHKPYNDIYRNLIDLDTESNK